MKRNFDIVLCLYLFSTTHFFFQESCCHEDLCNANMTQNVAFHGYYKNGSGIHNESVLTVVVMVHIISIVCDHTFSS